MPAHPLVSIVPACSNTGHVDQPGTFATVFDVSDGNSGISWSNADVKLLQPDGGIKKEKISLGGMGALLGGKSGETVYSFFPDKKGIYRLNVVAYGKDIKGHQLMRTFDRSFSVAAPGKGVKYRYEIDPFIRRRNN